MRKHRLVAFFLLTFGISWGIPGFLLLISYLTGSFEVSLQRFSPLSYLSIWAPAISAFTVLAVGGGGTAVRAYLRRLLHFRFAWYWYVAVLAGLPLLKLLASALASTTGQPGIVTPTVSAGAFLISAMLVATQGPMEELGWRGFALPLLQRRFNGLVASLILGVIWSLWHVPAFFMESVMTGSMAGELIPALVRFFAGTVALTITMTVVYNGSGGSIPLLFIFHWLENLAYPWESAAGISYMNTVITITVAAILIFTLSRRYLGRQNLYTDVTPGVPELG
ncbi:MAG: CPBP family intramembrane metalloprotease [Dehalococcoidia bacterium]|nr:CPBP family intramembrane metalloprotease [Dehalococcoidia bacterium]